MPAAAWRPLLRARRALGGGEGLALAPCAARGDRAGEALVAGAQGALGGEQQLELVLQRDGERVERVGRGPVPSGRRHRRQRGGRRRGLGLRDGERSRQRRLRPGAGDVARGGEAPAAADPHANADALRGRAVDRVDGAVEDRDRLIAGVDVARLGVGAAPFGGIIRSVRSSSIRRLPRRESGSLARRRGRGAVEVVAALDDLADAGLQRLLGDAEVAQLLGARVMGQPPCQRLHLHAGRGVERGQRLGRAPAQGDGRVGQHRGVRGAVPHAGEARQRLGEHVVQAVAGGVDDVARQQGAEGERVAVVLAGASRRAASRAASTGTGEARGVSGPSIAWPSALAADAASSSAGCEALRAGSLSTIRGRTRGVAGSTPRAWRCPRVISAALRVVGMAAPRRRAWAAASALATSTTRPPPSATSSSPATGSSRSPATSSTRPAATWCTAAAPATTAGADAAARGVVSST